MIGILIVAGVRLYREGLAHLFAKQPDMTVMDACASCADAISSLARDAADVVLVDMVEDEGRAAASRLHEILPSVPIVALGIAGSESEIVTCAEFGVVAYVTRDGTFDELLNVVRAAARGELLCSPRIAGTLARRVATLAARRQPTIELARLTQREREIVALIQQDLSNKEIAVRLGIEVATVKNHVHNLMEKLNAHSRVAVSRLTDSKGRGTRI